MALAFPIRNSHVTKLYSPYLVLCSSSVQCNFQRIYDVAPQDPPSPAPIKDMEIKAAPYHPLPRSYPPLFEWQAADESMLITSMLSYLAAF